MTDALGRAAFRRRLQRLPRARYRRFVAALYADRPQVVVVGPEGPVAGPGDRPADGEARTVYAHHPRDRTGPDPEADAVVSPTDDGPGAGPGYLFDLVRHGTPEGPAVCREYLGAAPSDDGPPAARSDGSAGPWLARPNERNAGWSWGRARAALASALVPPRAPPASVVLAAAVVVAAVATAGLGTALVGDRDATGVAGGTPTPTAAATAAGRTDATPADPVRAGPGAGRYATLRPTCERPPRTVVRIQLGAFRSNDPATDAGIRAAFSFAAPSVRRDVGSVREFAALLRSPTFDPLLNNTRVSIGPMAYTDATAETDVAVVTADGRTYRYRWQLTRQAGGEYAGCWMTTAVVLRGIEPADGGRNASAESTAAPGGAPD